jgi:hypothetical protein
MEPSVFSLPVVLVGLITDRIADYQVLGVNNRSSKSVWYEMVTVSVSSIAFSMLETTIENRAPFRGCPFC